jgi:hypothetical protein
VIAAILCAFALLGVHQPDVRTTVPQSIPLKKVIKESFVMPCELIDTGSDKRFVRRDEDGK